MLCREGIIVDGAEGPAAGIASCPNLADALVQLIAAPPIRPGDYCMRGGLLLQPMPAEDHLATEEERLQAKGCARAETCASIYMSVENVCCLSGVPLSPLPYALPGTGESVKVGGKRSGKVTERSRLKKTPCLVSAQERRVCRYVELYQWVRRHPDWLSTAVPTVTAVSV